MTNRGWLGIGLGGAFAAVVCCVTPVLPWLLGAVGLSSVIGYIYRDAVLLPLAAIFLVIAGYALWRLKRPE